MAGNISIKDLTWPADATGVPAPLALVREIKAADLREFATAATVDPALIAHHETLPFLDKLILARDPATGAQLRLHRYTSLGTGDIHDHRWSFAARILTGAYEQRRFRALAGNETELESSQTVAAGSTYFIHWRDLHSVTALELPTWTLVLRGPPQQRAFRVVAEDGSVTEKLGAADEAATDRQQKQMPTERLLALAAEFATTEICPLAVD